MGIDADGISDAVSAEKQQAPESDARAARTINLVTSAAAEGVAAVSDDCPVMVRNDVSVTKSLGRYDAATQTQHFTITVSAAPDNPYLEYYLPLYDEVTSAANTGAIAESGVAEVTVRHADGVTERAALAAYARLSSREWRAALPTVVPGDVFTIDAYTKVSDAFWEQTGQGSAGDTDTGNRVALGSGVSAGDYYANDLEARSASVRFSIIKRYLTKRCVAVDEEGAVEWEILETRRGRARNRRISPAAPSPMSSGPTRSLPAVPPRWCTTTRTGPAPAPTASSSRRGPERLATPFPPHTEPAASR